MEGHSLSIFEGHIGEELERAPAPYTHPCSPHAPRCPDLCVRCEAAWRCSRVVWRSAPSPGGCILMRGARTYPPLVPSITASVLDPILALPS